MLKKGGWREEAGRGGEGKEGGWIGIIGKDKKTTS